MEKEGLQRVLNYLNVNGMVVDVLVTDRHRQINKWLRDSHPEIKHFFDVWHVAKGKLPKSYCQPQFNFMNICPRVAKEVGSCRKTKKLRID